jgi:hypothetical protein
MYSCIVLFDCLLAASQDLLFFGLFGLALLQCCISTT